MLTISIVVPTYNAGGEWPDWINRVTQQKGVQINQILVVDSSSLDATRQLSADAGFTVHQISKLEFNHGATRQLAIELLPQGTDIVVFLTQDALLADDQAIQQLVAVFEDSQVGCAYGRQLPHVNASPLGAHARLFNYPAESYVRGFADRHAFGIKTAFLSNSFAAYRFSALTDVGGFPARVILAEDMIVAAKMLQQGYLVAYVADACVYHSHDYTPWQEFKRYFDIGVLHHRESWLLSLFGSPQGEGKRFVLSEWRYLFRHAPMRFGSAILSTAMKWLGYQLGRHEAYIPVKLKPLLSMYKGFWHL